MRSINQDPTAGPYIALISNGSASNFFAKMDSFNEWRAKVQLLTSDESQQDGHQDTIGAQSAIPSGAQNMLLGDGLQQPHTGNPSKQGSRKATAHLEASKATLRSKRVLPLPIETLLEVLVNAGKSELDYAQQAPTAWNTDPLHLYKSLHALLRDPQGVEEVQRFLQQRFPNQEISLLLNRSYRLPYPTYIFYLTAEQYFKVIFSTAVRLTCGKRDLRMVMTLLRGPITVPFSIT